MKIDMPIPASAIKRALSVKHSRDFFLTECKTGATWANDRLLIMDSIAIKKSWAHPHFYGYEIKVTRADFLSDEKWVGYLDYCHSFSFVCPKDIIFANDLPSHVGLLYFNPEKQSLRTVKKAVIRQIELPADLLYYIILSRIDSSQYPFFSTRKEYFLAWLQNKIDNKEISYRIRSKIGEELQKSQQALDQNKSLIKSREELFAIKDFLSKSGFPTWDLLATIRAIIESKVPPQILNCVNKAISELEKIRNIANANQN